MCGEKIPTLFERVYVNHRKVDILPNVTKGMEWVLDSVVEYGKIQKRLMLERFRKVLGIDE